MTEMIEIEAKKEIEEIEEIKIEATEIVDKIEIIEIITETEIMIEIKMTDAQDKEDTVKVKIIIIRHS